MSKIALARLLAWSLAALSLTLVVAGIGITWRAGRQWPVTHMLFAPATAVTYALVGVLVASRHPRNPIGWIFSAEGVLAGLASLSSSYEMVGHSMLPGFEVVRWLGLWIWIPTTILPLTFVLLLFPDGRLPSPRWWPVAWSAGLGLAAYTLSTALHPRPPIEPIAPVNPFGIPGAVGVLDLLASSTIVLLPVGAFGSLAALVVRFRRSRGVEREQVKWLTYGGVVAILGLIAMSAWSAARPYNRVAYELMIGGIWVALMVIVIAAGIAILRHQLYDIDLIINRTLVYGALSAGVVGLYVLLVGALGALFQSSGNLVIALLATGLAALLAQPLRARLQRGVNRLMYGERDDPYAVLSSLSQQLKTTLAPTAVLPNIAQAVARTLKLPYVALALTHGNRLEIAASYGMAAGEPMRLPLVYQAETVGQLLVAPRAPGEAFTPSERQLLEDIALQAGVAAHAVRLTADLQRSRERLVTAREEERRRLRRDLHDGLGPQLASLTLTLAAARELLRQDVDAADRLLQELAIHTQAAITDIRRVVYDLRPPALDDLGLVLALREQATNYRQAGLQITIAAPEHMPPLPAAVEVAAYRIVQEALTNVVRHAQARTCAVRLTLGDALDVEIKDDGIGLPKDGRAGVGLTSMRERTAELGGTWVIETAPSRGTCIRVQLPLHQEGA
ncbi:MAG: GAF domain-containing sensor histidine kinase [Roseiflexaceae bacterium]